MEEKTIEATDQRPEGDRRIDAALVTIDLPLYMEQIRSEPPWKEGKRNAILFSRPVDFELYWWLYMKEQKWPGILPMASLACKFWKGSFNLIQMNNQLN